MEGRKSFLVLAFFLLLVITEAAYVLDDGNGNENIRVANGPGGNNNGNYTVGTGKKKADDDDGKNQSNGKNLTAKKEADQKKETPKKETSNKETTKKETPNKETPKKVAKETPKKKISKKEVPKKEAPEKETPKKETPKKETAKKKAPKKETRKKKAPKKETPKKETHKKKTPKKETPKKEAPKKDTPKKEVPKKETPKKETPKKKRPSTDPATTNYDILTSLANGRERVLCKARGLCHSKTLTCPAECPQKKPKHNKKKKGCFVDCSSKCEVTCKFRRPNCNGYGSLCYDPRFVGGDGVMFYFHGAKGGNFAIVSDDNIHINAHFIGTRPQGRTRDFTWVQALAVMFDSHTLVISAKKVSKWNDKVDALIVSWDGETIDIPIDGDAEWKTNNEEREVVVERTYDTNSVRLTVAGLLELDVKVRPIGEEENKIHKYQLPADDAFAHLETQFKFKNLSDLVEGVLGKTYRPDYVSPVKIGVPMPLMGGEDNYQTPSLFSPLCKACRFQRPSSNGGLAEY